MSIADDVRPLLQAVSFAARAHQGQFRKDGKTPYASHPCRVAFVVRDVFAISDQQVVTAALLHDTLEDTTTDFDDLVETFGRQVAAWVAALSKDKRLPEDEREAAYIKQLQESPWQVHVCKLADIFDNLLDCAFMDTSGRRHVVKRTHFYLSAIKEVLTEPAQRAWQLAWELHASVAARLDT